MKKYNKPEIKIAVLNNEDILMISGGINLNSGNFDASKKYTNLNF